MTERTQITGRIIHGNHYGRVLGFPTANLDRHQYSRKKMKVRLGVWAGSAVVGRDLIGPNKQSPYLAAIVIGPIDKKGLPKIEAHLIGFKGLLYGKKITIRLNKYLRPFKKYKGEEELKKQIVKDINSVNKHS